MKFSKIYNLNRKKIILIVIYSVPVLFFLWFLSKYFVVSGNFKDEYKFNSSSSIISNLYPSNRVDNPELDLITKNKYQRINSEPVYFDISVPRPFKRIELDFSYFAPNQPIIEIGVKRSPEELDYDFKTIQNKFIENLKDNWNKIEKSEDNLIFLEKGKKPDIYENNPDNSESDSKFQYEFDNINNFLNDIPKDKVVGYYKYDINNHLKLNNYKNPKSTIQINNPLQGSHEFYTYIKNEDLDFNFSYYDTNREPGDDNILVNVYNSGNIVIYSNNIADDGNDSADRNTSQLNGFNLQIPNLSEGQYKIELKTSDDVIFTKINTKQKYIVFHNKLNLAASNEFKNQIKDIYQKPSNVYFNGTQLNIKTFYQSGNQQIRIKNKNYNISQDNEDYFKINFNNPNNDLNKLNSSKNGLLLLSDGFFVFNNNHYFEPFTKVYPLVNFQYIDQMDYLIASTVNYYRPNKKGDWYRNQVEFNLSKAYIEDNKYKFVISSPNINRNEFMMRQLKCNLNRDPIWHNFIPRLKNKLFNTNES